LSVAKINVDAFCMSDRIKLSLGNWLDGITNKFVVLMCNPPYIDSAEFEHLSDEVRVWEPAIALMPHDGDGLSVYKELAPRIGSIMEDDGIALFETPIKYERPVADLFIELGYVVDTLKDIEGITRGVCVHRGSA